MDHIPPFRADQARSTAGFEIGPDAAWRPMRAAPVALALPRWPATGAVSLWAPTK